MSMALFGTLTLGAALAAAVFATAGFLAVALATAGAAGLVAAGFLAAIGSATGLVLATAALAGDFAAAFGAALTAGLTVDLVVGFAAVLEVVSAMTFSFWGGEITSKKVQCVDCTTSACAGSFVDHGAFRIGACAML
jgi:hypothetical protein